MKKSKFLVPLACFSLLIAGLVGCGKKGNEPSSSASKSTPSSGTVTPSSSGAPVSSSEAEPTELFYSLPFGYDQATKWEKGHEYKWTFDVKENHAKMTFAFGALMSSDSHSDRSLYTDHNGASTSDPFESNAANDGTCRIVLKVNGVEQTIFHTTYGEAGLTTSELNYFKVAEFAVKKGNVEVSMTTHASVGYRLLLGGEARLYYPAKEQPLTLSKVTFMNGTEKFFEEEYFPGELPAIPEALGLPAKAPSAEGAYIFRGWDKPIAAANGDAVYTAQFAAAPLVVRSAKLEVKEEKLVLTVEGETKVVDNLTNAKAQLQFKHNDNQDHHGWEWDGNAYEAAATFAAGKFSASVNVNDIAKLIEYRDSAFIFQVNVCLGEKNDAEQDVFYSVELKNDYQYQPTTGVYANNPNVDFVETEVTLGNIKAHLVVGEWTCVYLMLHNGDVRSLAAKTVSLKEIDGAIYYVIRGEAIGYTADELAGAKVDYQHNDNIDHQGWGFVPALEDGQAETIGKQQSTGHTVDIKTVANDQFEIGFKVSDIAEDLSGVVGKASVLTVHMALQALEGTTERPSCSYPIDTDYAPIVKDGYRFSLMNINETWGITALVVGKLGQDYLAEGAAIEADDDGVYYVVSGMAGSHTAADFEGGEMTLVHNGNFNGKWDEALAGHKAAKAVVADGMFKQYFRVDNVDAIKPANDGDSYVYTTKVTPFEGGDLYEVKRILLSEEKVSRGGYEYSITVTASDPQNTWGILSLTVKKLAA